MLVLVATRGGRGGHGPGNHDGHGDDGGDDDGNDCGGFVAIVLLSSVICHGGSEMGNPRTLNLFGDLSHTGSQRSPPPHRPRCRTAKNQILKSLLQFLLSQKVVTILPVRLHCFPNLSKIIVLPANARCLSQEI